MKFYEDEFERYQGYEEQFDPLVVDRKGRRKRKPMVDPNERKKKHVQADEVAQTIGLEGGFEPSYQTSRHEDGWLLQSLAEFYDKELISDVNALIKGGKEASVYRCTAHPHTGLKWVAAKVYRPRMFRNLRNDKMYRQGRLTLKASGKSIKATDTRAMRALGKKSTYGEQLAHTSWLMHEYTTLERFQALGIAVPKPIASAANAILMEYIGDENMPAPTLNQMTLEQAEANCLFQVVLDNIELMLGDGRIHGDLSAYNILYWEGKLTIIDFPQVANARVSRDTHLFGSRVNPDAEFILERDITRVCEYFQRQGVQCDPGRVMNKLWNTYVANDPAAALAEASRFATDDLEIEK